MTTSWPSSAPTATDIGQRTTLAETSGMTGPFVGVQQLGDAGARGDQHRVRDDRRLEVRARTVSPKSHTSRPSVSRRAGPDVAGLPGRQVDARRPACSASRPWPWDGRAGGDGQSGARCSASAASEAGAAGSSEPESVQPRQQYHRQGSDRTAAARRPRRVTTAAPAVRVRVPPALSAAAGSIGPSSWRSGMIRSSHRGSHQACSPSIDIIAGTSTIRTTLASISTATAMPTASILIVGSESRTKLEKTTTMIAAAVVITRAVPPIPIATRDARRRSAPGLVHPRQQEHLVVHRQPEHDREHQHRHERRDRHLLVDADQRGAPAPLEHRDDDAVRGPDRQQVEHRRLDGDRPASGTPPSAATATAARRRRSATTSAARSAR